MAENGIKGKRADRGRKRGNARGQEMVEEREREKERKSSFCFEGIIVETNASFPSNN